MEILRKIIKCIQACVQGLKCKIKYVGVELEELSVETGLRQEDALLPALFNIMLESVIRETG